MRQSTVVILTLFLAFIVFVTMKGELPQYLGLLGIGSTSGSSTSTTAPPVNIFGSSGPGSPAQNLFALPAVSSS